METLPEVRSLSGHDGYCHVCWEDFYALWTDSTNPPPNHRCVVGAKTAHECPQAMGRASLRAFLAAQAPPSPSLQRREP